MRFLSVFLVYIKRQLKSPAFLAAMLIIPLVIPVVAKINTGDTKGFDVGFYCENNELSSALVSVNETVSFKPYTNVDKMTRDVENKNLNCAYILSDNILTEIMQNKDGSVICLKSPSSVLTEVANEAIFAQLSYFYADDMAQLYLDREGISYDRQKLEQYYSTYLSSGKAIGIKYSYAESGTAAEESGKTDVDWLAGVISVYIMLGGILSLKNRISDKDNSIPFGFMNTVASVAILTLCSVITFAFMGGISIMLVLRLVLYAVLVSCYCTIIGYICCSEALISGLLPVLILGSLILCPVFIDIKVFMPWLGSAGYIFAPYYFMADTVTLAIGTAFMALLTVVVGFVKGR